MFPPYLKIKNFAKRQNLVQQGHQGLIIWYEYPVMILFKRILFIRIALYDFMMYCEMIHTNYFNLQCKQKL